MAGVMALTDFGFSSRIRDLGSTIKKKMGCGLFFLRETVLYVPKPKHLSATNLFILLCGLIRL